MTEIASSSLIMYVLFLFIPFAFALLARLLKVSPLIGYIIGGLCIGNLFRGVFAAGIVDQFAFFGIILLLFTVGLEINFNRLLGVGKYIITAGILQALFTFVLVFILSNVFHFNLMASFIIAFACISSSTVLVAKIIQERGEESTFMGEIAIGILMFQDLLFIPLLIMFNSLSNHSSQSFFGLFLDVGVGVGKAIIILAVMFSLGKRLVPFLFEKIAGLSKELLNLFVLLFIVMVVYLCTLLHLPILIGVFVAGILVAQTQTHFQVFSQIRPLRDILAVVFFVYIGANIDIPTVIPMLPAIVLFTGLLIIIKVVVFFSIFLKLRFHSRLAFSLSLLLFQISENAFILMFAAYQNHIFARNDYLFMSTSVLLSLLITPFVIAKRDVWYKDLSVFITHRIPNLKAYIVNHFDSNISPINKLSIQDHVVICGYGRIGQQIGKALLGSKIPFVAIDFNFHIVEQSQKEGITSIYGDPTDIDILDFAQVDTARIVVVAVADRASQESIVLNVERLNPRAIIIARVHHKEDGQRLKDLGVEVIIQPEFEASIAIIRKLLWAFNTSQDDITLHIKQLKLEHGI